MRLLALTCAAALLAPGCVSVRGGETGASVDYVDFQSYDRTWQTAQFGIRRNLIPSTGGAPVSFNLVMSYSENILVDRPGPFPPEISAWVGYDGVDSLGLGEGSTLVLYIDGSAVALPSALDARRRGVLLGPFDRQHLTEREFGGGGEFGLYPLSLDVVRQLATASEIQFEIRGVNDDVEREMSRSSLHNVQRFVRERLVQKALVFLE